MPLQEEGTYVKSVLQNGIDTTFDLTSVAPDEIVRPKEDSGVINANMFNFGEQVRFQITPSEPFRRTNLSNVGLYRKWIRISTWYL